MLPWFASTAIPAVISSVHRFVSQLVRIAEPDVPLRLTFKPGEAAQVDFGAGPLLTDVRTGETFKTWFFVMTLCGSRHQYAELVRDQNVATGLARHRQAFQWFGGVVERVIIDNPKCAITRVYLHDPEVQRVYAECAEGYAFKVDPCPPRDPAKKGIVEAGVKYVKRAFLPLREFGVWPTSTGRPPSGCAAKPATAAMGPLARSR